MKLQRISAILLAGLFLLTGCGAKSLSAEAFDVGMEYFAMAETSAPSAMYNTGGSNKYAYSDSADYYDAPVEMESVSMEAGMEKPEAAENDLTERKIIKNANLEYPQPAPAWLV